MMKAKTQVTQVSFDLNADIERLQQLTKIALAAAEVDLADAQRKREATGNLSLFGRFRKSLIKKSAEVGDSLLSDEHIGAARLGHGSQVVKTERAAEAAAAAKVGTAENENKYPYQAPMDAGGASASSDDLISFSP
jgi:hypothetical protein